MKSENRVKRDEFFFVGERAADSGKYYDIVLSHGEDVDLLYLAWDACHKFGCRLVGHNITSYRDGVATGENSLGAAEYIDGRYRDLKSTLPEQNRKKLLNAEMQKVIYEVMEKYEVEVKCM